MSNKIPIYNIGGIEKSRSCAAFPWWKPVCTMCNMAIEYPIKKAIKYQVLYCLSIFMSIFLLNVHPSFYSSLAGYLTKEGGDIKQFITLVPKVL